MHILIEKDGKHFELKEYVDYNKNVEIFLSREDGEGMGVDQKLFYDHIDKFFIEHM